MIELNNFTLLNKSIKGELIGYKSNLDQTHGLVIRLEAKHTVSDEDPIYIEIKISHGDSERYELLASLLKGENRSNIIKFN